MDDPSETVKRFYAERIHPKADQSLTATTLYEDYCCWCERQKLEPLWLSEFCRLFRSLGVPKARIAGKVRYLGVTIVGDPDPDS